MENFNVQLRAPYQQSIDGLRSGALTLEAFKQAIGTKLDGLRHLNGLKQHEQLEALRGSDDPDVRAMAGLIEGSLRSQPSFDTMQRLNQDLDRFARGVVSGSPGARKQPAAAVALLSAEQVQAISKGMHQAPTGNVDAELAKFVALARATKARIPAGFSEAFAAEIGAAESMIITNFDLATKIEEKYPTAGRLIPALIQNTYSLLADVRFAAERYFAGDQETAARVMGEYKPENEGQMAMTAIMVSSWASNPEAVMARATSLAEGTATSEEKLRGFVNAD
jgi:hypothetical protein